MGERLKTKSRAHWIAFFVCLSVSIILMVGGAIVPPPFVIDASIFKAVGWLFGFAALAQVPAIVESGKSATIQKGDTSLTIGDGADEDEETSQEE